MHLARTTNPETLCVLTECHDSFHSIQGWKRYWERWFFFNTEQKIWCFNFSFFSFFFLMLLPKCSISFGNIFSEDALHGEELTWSCDEETSGIYTFHFWGCTHPMLQIWGVLLWFSLQALCWISAKNIPKSDIFWRIFQLRLLSPIPLNLSLFLCLHKASYKQGWFDSAVLEKLTTCPHATWMPSHKKLR